MPPRTTLWTFKAPAFGPLPGTSAPHEDVRTCPLPWRGVECVCDLRAFARAHSDWPIAILVGSATYAQLLDAGPGLFEPFPYGRHDGSGMSSVAPLNGDHHRVARCASTSTTSTNLAGGALPVEFASPPPPNLVSTILADGHVTVGDLKRRLLRAAAATTTKCGFNDDVLAPIIGSSVSYRGPVLTIAETLSSFVFLAVMTGIVIAAFTSSLRTSVVCRGGGINDCRRRRDD